ncbi:MAG: D-isomer specific 2-hydroxyacid dehydrogenase family protein [Microbacterium sp.]
MSLEPDRITAYEEAVVDGGGVIAPLSESRVLVWSKHGGTQELADTIARMPNLEWVQLPSAGVDNFATAGVLREGIVWTSAKGAYARPVAEHALALVLALLRVLPTRARARSWAAQEGRSLHGLEVLVLGGGGIASELAALLRPFDVRLVVCKRTPAPAPFADETVPSERFAAAARTADVVVLAAPLSEATRGIVDRTVLDGMRPDAVIVNVGRGGLIVTDDLLTALADGAIAGAGLDVTDPEPLPDGHPLWDEPRALITPHTADTEDMIIPLLADRIRENIARWRRGDALLGPVDVLAGY